MVREIPSSDLNVNHLEGLSTDAKPTGYAVGSDFVELDTGVIYAYDGNGNWYPQLSTAQNANVSQMTKGVPQIVFAAIAATTTSSTINLTGYNSSELFIEITGTGVWKLEALVSSNANGNFIPLPWPIGFYSSSVKVDMPKVANFVKFVATEVVDGSTLTLTAQPSPNFSMTQIPPYDDKGLIINQSNVASTGTTTLYSPWFDNMQWVRNLHLAIYCAGGNFNLSLNTRDTSQQAFDDTSLKSGESAAAYFRTYRYAPSNGVTGWSFRIAIVLTAAVTYSNVSAKLQVLG